jgi:hypothetical protein
MSNSTKAETMVRGLTSYLRSLANRRNDGIVTADDVHAYLNRRGISARATRTRLSFVNSVLRSPVFESAGSVYSSRPQAKGRSITAWTLA